MDPRKVLARFDGTYARWREAVERRDDEALLRERGEGAWTLGQVCDHVASLRPAEARP